MIKFKSGKEKCGTCYDKKQDAKISNSIANVEAQNGKLIITRHNGQKLEITIGAGGAASVGTWSV